MDTISGYKLAQVGKGKAAHYSTGNDETVCGRPVTTYVSFGDAANMPGGFCSRCSRYVDTHGDYQGWDEENGARFLSITNPRPEVEDLTGRYEPNEPGARTLRDARPLSIDGKRVTVTIEGDTLYLYVGGTWLYSGPIPEEIKTRADVNPWAARTALADPAKWAQVGARIGVPMGHGTVTSRNIWADGTYVIGYRSDLRDGDDWLVTAASENLSRLCALCDTVGDSDDDPEYPARFSPSGAYLCGFCSHAYLDRYVPHTLPGRPEDGWGIFDRENVWFTNICMTEEQAKARADELNYRTPAAFDRPAPETAQEAPQDGRASLSGLPLPVVTTGELLALLGPLTDAERLAVDLAGLDAPTDPAA
ncbi:hypothetical protein [Streptomyces sp. NPDC002758]